MGAFRSISGFGLLKTSRAAAAMNAEAKRTVVRNDESSMIAGSKGIRMREKEGTQRIPLLFKKRC